MLGRWRRRRANTDPTLIYCLVFAGITSACPRQTRYIKTIMGECWPNVCDAGPTFTYNRFKAFCLLDPRSSSRYNTDTAHVVHLICIMSLDIYGRLRQ